MDLHIIGKHFNSHAITKQTWKVIYEQEEKKRTQDAVLWYTTDDFG